MTNKVDWGKAPEGATFYALGRFRKESDVGEFYHLGRWVAEPSCGDYQSSFKLEIDYQERPQPITEIRIGDFIHKSELDTKEKYNDVVRVFEKFGFKIDDSKFEMFNLLNEVVNVNADEDGRHYCGVFLSPSDGVNRKLTYDQIMSLDKAEHIDVDNCNVDKMVSMEPCKVKDTRLGSKHDSDKMRFSLIPQQPLKDVNSVLEFGAKKYGDNNWMEVDNAQERYFNAAMRHILAWQSGELLDDESGLPHLAHAQCCLMFMMHFDD